MISRTTRRFRSCFDELPPSIQEQSRKAYRLFSHNPQHPSLHFKRIHPVLPVFSVRISRDYRAVGALQDNEIVWFWIGSQADYNKIPSRL